MVNEANNIDYSTVAARWRAKGATHRIDLTGDYLTTINDLARRLLAEGANPADTVETWRSGKLTMAGQVGELAKWRFVFGSSGPRLTPYVSPTSAAPADKSPSDPVEASHGK